MSCVFTSNFNRFCQALKSRSNDGFDVVLENQTDSHILLLYACGVFPVQYKTKIEIFAEAKGFKAIFYWLNEKYNVELPASLQNDIQYYSETNQFDSELKLAKEISKFIAKKVGAEYVVDYAQLELPPDKLYLVNNTMKFLEIAENELKQIDYHTLISDTIKLLKKAQAKLMQINQ